MNAPLLLTPIENSLLEQLPKGDLAKALLARGLPNRRVEDWRWTDLRNTLREPKELSSAYASDVADSLLATDDVIQIIFANGQLLKQPVYLPDNIILSLSDPDLPDPRATMPALASSLTETVLTIRVAGNVDRPFLIRYLSDGAAMHQTRVRVILEDGAEAGIVETHEGMGAWFANGLTEITVGEGAKLSRTLVQANQGDAVNIQTGIVILSTHSDYRQTALTLGSKLSRFETCLQHAGGKARASLNGAYLLSDSNHVDHTTKVDHHFVGGVTEELFKGVIRDRGRGVFQGKFLVAKGAQQTDARMAHNALLLSDTAEVNAKPELEIYADNVQCAHGNTAGALDENAVFYMRQRGLSEEQARTMLVEAFVGDVLTQVEDEQLLSKLTGLVRDWMGGVS